MTVTLVTGAVGYIGMLTCAELVASGRTVRGLDALLHRQGRLATQLGYHGIKVVQGDIRDPQSRQAALTGVDEVVHLAAIVGDPACQSAPDVSRAVNVDGTRALLQDAKAAGVRRFVFASTCSNYGRTANRAGLITEDGDLAPVSTYANQKVEIERWLLQDDHGPVLPTCLRFATVYGVAPRMRFDLTVNEFTRDLWAGRPLDIFGDGFWRPYVHVGDAARAIRLVLEAPQAIVGGAVYNVGHSSENYRKRDLVEIIQRQTGTGRVRYVERREDPRDYRVSFEKIREELGYQTTMTVPRGVAEVIAALREDRFPDPFARGYRNTD